MKYRFSLQKFGGRYPRFKRIEKAVCIEAPTGLDAYKEFDKTWGQQGWQISMFWPMEETKK